LIIESSLPISLRICTGTEDMIFAGPETTTTLIKLEHLFLLLKQFV
jgi:hypothetical protein